MDFLKAIDWSNPTTWLFAAAAGVFLWGQRGTVVSWFRKLDTDGDGRPDVPDWLGTPSEEEAQIERIRSALGLRRWLATLEWSDALGAFDSHIWPVLAKEVPDGAEAEQ